MLVGGVWGCSGVELGDYSVVAVGTAAAGVVVVVGWLGKQGRIEIPAGRCSEGDCC